jgi:hypothetical protein
MLHWRRMLSLRDIRSRLNEIDMKFSTNRTRYICMWKWQVQFSSRCETNPKSCWKKRNNYFLLKKPTYGPVSEVQRSNQLRYKETVVEVSRDVHV